MKKFLKENWFKIIIVLLFLSMIIVYLYIIKPSQDKKELLFNSIKCQQEGYKIYEKDKEKFYKELQSICGRADCKILFQSFYEPEFLFEEDMNTCLYKQVTFEMLEDKSSSYTAYDYKIKDVYSNKIFKKQHISKEDGEEYVSGDKDFKFYDNKYFPKK